MILIEPDVFLNVFESCEFHVESLSRQVEKFRVNFAKLSGLEELDITPDVDHATTNLKRKLKRKSKFSKDEMITCKTITQLSGNRHLQNKIKQITVL